MTLHEPAAGDAAPAVCAEDFARRAAACLPPGVWDFIEGGSGTERVLGANRTALEDIALVPRMLRGAASTSTAAPVVGAPASMPVAVAPMAYHQLVHPDGELATAQAAKTAGVPFTVGMLSSRSVEEIAGTGATLWFQLYWLRERERMLDLIRRAEAAGCQAVMITIDVAVMGRRLRDLRNGFALPSQVRAVHLPPGPSRAHLREQGASAVAEHTRSLLDPAAGWQDVEWLRAQTSLPLIVKGVLDPSDALRAVACGADAVVVSNHGGRQFDGAPASVAVLPEVRAAVGDRAEVLLDSGIRSGLDVLRALALGASGVLVGRPVLWSLAADGAAGVEQLLALLRTELADGLTLLGCGDVSEAARLRALLGPHAAPGREARTA
ncbi:MULTISPECIES: alpha-hydroxy-acid oxidizing protein [unclassified Streptomyces]|uniref:alpha-hydroxy acid oxidase n=1 Tax=unclassified Streptomyces TaxID=2593676 RepID=UPI0036E1DC5F